VLACSGPACVELAACCNTAWCFVTFNCTPGLHIHCHTCSRLHHSGGGYSSATRESSRSRRRASQGLSLPCRPHDRFKSDVWYLWCGVTHCIHWHAEPAASLRQRQGALDRRPPRAALGGLSVSSTMLCAQACSSSDSTMQAGHLPECFSHARKDACSCPNKRVELLHQLWKCAVGKQCANLGSQLHGWRAQQQAQAAQSSSNDIIPRGSNARKYRDHCSALTGKSVFCAAQGRAVTDTQPFQQTVAAQALTARPLQALLNMCHARAAANSLACPELTPQVLASAPQRSQLTQGQSRV